MNNALKKLKLFVYKSLFWRIFTIHCLTYTHFPDKFCETDCTVIIIILRIWWKWPFTLNIYEIYSLYFARKLYFDVVYNVHVISKMFSVQLQMKFNKLLLLFDLFQSFGEYEATCEDIYRIYTELWEFFFDNNYFRSKEL